MLKYIKEAINEKLFREKWQLKEDFLQIVQSSQG